jgi:fructokinase
MTDRQRRIFTIGETVLDIIFKNGRPVTATAGGSMLNTAVSLGRLHLPVSFISEYGKDEVGELVDGFLHQNGVDTRYVFRFEDGRSALALAFLDEHNNAEYSFYKSYPDKRFQIAFPEVNKNDIVMFGSIYAVAAELRTALLGFLHYAKSKNALLYYDPNFRKPHLDELEVLKPAILENIAMADIVRASDEDLSLIFGARNVDEGYFAVKSLCPNLIYTASSTAVYLTTASHTLRLPTRKIEPVSTIGAGDTFNAAIAYGLCRHGIGRKSLSLVDIATWQQLLEYGIDFATEVCLSYDNYIPADFADRLPE